MERWTLVIYLLIALMFACSFRRTSQQQISYEKDQRQQKSERTVIFPVFNDTERSLPVFPEQEPKYVTAPPTPVHKYVNFVGQKPPLAPRVDNFGQPFCKRKKDDTFCAEVEDYPDMDIRRAMSYSSEEFKELFGSLTINPRKIAPSDLSEQTVCAQQARLFYPKAAVNENERWAYVVNDVDYVQAVMAEICEKEDGPCSYLDGALPSGVSSRCRQKYAYKRLLALHPEQKKTYTDAFRFPSCCVCYVKRPFIMSRTREIRVDDKKAASPQSSPPQRSRGL